MRKAKGVIGLFIALLVAVLLPLPALADDDAMPYEEMTRTICEGFMKPLRIALGDDGSIYVLDGMVLKKYNDGQVSEVANLLDSSQYFAKYNLSEIEDLYTFRPGTMVYTHGAIFMAGLMMDRCEPTPYNEDYEPGCGWNKYKIGSAYSVIVKVTDHFEPILVEGQALNLTIGEYEYQGLMRNDPSYTNKPIYKDYTTRFRNLTIPNLTLAPDGNMYVIKDTAIKHMDHSNNTITLTHRDIGKLYDPKVHYIYSNWGGVPALYKIYPDGRQEILDEHTYHMFKESDKGTLDSFMVSNKYLRKMNDSDPDNDTTYALPSQEDPENSVIVCNESYVWKYNFKTHTHGDIDFIPGNEMPNGNKVALMPDHVYAPTMPRTTKTLGNFFCNNYSGIIWRLYADRYYQDFGHLSLIPYNDDQSSVVDWAIDEDKRTIYALLDSGKLTSVNFSNYVHYAPGQNGDFQMPGNAPDNTAFKVMFDQNRQTIYSVNGSRGPYTRDGSLYVPIDPVAYILDISVLEDTLCQTLTGNYYSIKLSNTNFNSTARVDIEIYREGDVIQKFAEINHLMDTIYKLTGMKYKTRYDVTTNTLYIQPETGSMQLFKGLWR